MLTAFINRSDMLVYRIAHTMFIKDLTGEGPRLNGGRWNHPGTPCIYTSASRALSLLEYTCHTRKHLIPRDLSFATFDIPDHSIQTFSIGQLPGNWNRWPHPRESRDFGTRFLADNQFLLYCIPSVVIEEEMNYIINTRHVDAKRIKIVEVKEYAYDLRLKT